MAKIAYPTRSMASTMIGPRALGRISMNIVYQGLSPRVSAARMYSRVRISRVRLRTSRAIPGVPTMVMAMTTFTAEAPRAVMMIKNSRITGMAIMASSKRMVISSSQPP